MFFLSGSRVVDLTTMIQGPEGTLLLADMGAEVVKVEPLSGDPYRGLAGDFLAMNGGKKSLAVDLKQSAGKEILLKLVRTAHVFAENSRPGALEKLGLDYGSLSSVKPGIIYVSMSGWGSKGPHKQRPSYDCIFQAASGHMVAQGGPDSPNYLRIPMSDYGGAMLGAFGVALGLFAAARGESGQHVETSLLAASTLLQSGDFLDWTGMERKYLGAQWIKGLSATNHLYKGSDGKWLMLFCAREAHWHSLCGVLHLASVSSDPRFASRSDREKNDAALVDLLETAFEQQPAAHWIAELRQAGVPVAPAQSHNELLSDPHGIAEDVFISQVHPLWGPTKVVGIAPRFSQMPWQPRSRAPLLGEHTDNLLIELGYSDEQIAELKHARVVSSPAPVAH